MRVFDLIAGDRRLAESIAAPRGVKLGASDKQEKHARTVLDAISSSASEIRDALRVAERATAMRKTYKNHESALSDDGKRMALELMGEVVSAHTRACQVIGKALSGLKSGRDLRR
jgi:hypothetical protein